MVHRTDGLTAPMALARYRDGEAIALGLVADGRIRPVGPEELGAPNLNAFLAEAPASWERLEAVAATEGPWRAIDEVELVAPVEPRQVLQTGANYRQHVIELVVAGLTPDPGRTPEEAHAYAADLMDKRAANGEPYFFIGLPACVVGDDVPLVLPAGSDRHDWELELAVVIGREAFQVSRDEAMQHVAGYTIVNDITTRDLVFRKDMKEIGTDWYRSKNAPGFLPTGPFLVPAAGFDPGAGHLVLSLDGEVKQDGDTADLLFDVPALVAAASQTLPLLPGDLLLTGSPAGNGQHWGRFLRDGDVMTGRIDGIGTQIVRCVAETTEVAS